MAGRNSLAFCIFCEKAPCECNKAAKATKAIKPRVARVGTPTVAEKSAIGSIEPSDLPVEVPVPTALDRMRARATIGSTASNALKQPLASPVPAPIPEPVEQPLAPSVEATVTATDTALEEAAVALLADRLGARLIGQPLGRDDPAFQVKVVRERRGI